MSAERAMDSGPSLFGRFGQPRENPQNMVPWDADMAKSMESTLAHIEAQRLQKEAEMNTPEGRIKAAEAKMAEILRKENDWISRVVIDRGNGWKPIWGSAEDQELRIYTLVDGGAHRFWGIKPIGMGIFEFWDKYDPEVKRLEDRQQETPVDPEAPTGPLIGEPSRRLSSPKKPAAKSRRRQKTPEINYTNRVRKSNKDSPKINKNTRKSIAERLDTEPSRPVDQVREMTGKNPVSSRPTRNKKVTKASGAQQTVTKERDSVPSKRPRGRPPIKEKVAKRPPKQKKTPAVKGNAKVTKSSQTKRRPSAPSVHKMRTRGKGPAELLQLP